MKIASVADAKAHFSHYIKESTDGAVVVTRNGRPVAVLLGVQDDEVERLVRYRLRRLSEILEKSKQQSGRGTWLSHQEFRKQIEAENAGEHEPEAPRPKARARKPRKS